MAAGHYAIDGAFLNRLGPDLVSAYSQALRVWHAFLHLKSRGSAVAVAGAGAIKHPASLLPYQLLAKRSKGDGSRAI